jgi:glycerophosphoryl diester phosphodiesterase
MAAFTAAVELGANAIELDIHATADGRIVVHHDECVGDVRIADSTLADVRRHPLANGEPMPVLDDVLQALGQEIKVFVEVKGMAPVHDDAFLGVLTGGPAPADYHVHAFDHRIVHRLLAQCEGLVGGVLSASYPLNPLIQLEQVGAEELWQRENLVDDELVAAVHAVGARVIPWTVDEPARIEELLDMGVDGICSNQPDVVRRVLG